MRGGNLSAGELPRPQVADMVLEIRHLVHEFQSVTGNALPVINDITAEVKAGQIIAIVGPSGSGKSTFLNLIAGRFPPTAGQILFDGTADPASAPPGHLGIVFQQPSLLPWRTIQENIALPLELIGKAVDAPATVATAIKQVDLNGFEDYLPSAVSGGMQSRAALARAIITAPRILLMDEPFGALDEMTAESLNIHLSSLLRNNSVTTLIVTHQLTQAIFLADRLWIFSPRPATLVADIRIDAPTPRGTQFLESQQFYAYLSNVRSIMRKL